MADIGAFSTTVIDKTNKRITKTYIEYRGEEDSPYLSLIGSNVYVSNIISENDSHKRLYESLPNLIPKIYNYNEKAYLSVLENERPPIPEPIVDKPREMLKICKVEMDYLPFPSLQSIHERIFTKSNLNEVKHVLTQWFELQLRIIGEAHIVPWDVHLGNMLYDESNKKLYIIDYAYYEFFELVERLDNETTKRNDIIYWFDPIKDKHKLYKDNLNIKSTNDFELTNEEVCEIFMFRLSWFASFRNATKLHILIATLYGMKTCVDLHIQVMKKLGFKQNQIDLVCEALTNSIGLFAIVRSVRNWLGGPFGKTCSSHRILSYMKIYPDKFQKMYDEIMNDKKLFKMTKDEFWKWDRDNISTLPVMYRQFAHMLYLKYNPFDEMKNLLGFVYRNLVTMNTTLYRCETTDRFNEEQNKLKIGKIISWDNIIPATERKEYALSYLNDARGSAFTTQNNPIHILFVFNSENVKAAHVRNDFSNYTTYMRRYNASNPSDTNRLNCNHPCMLIVSNEYIVEPFKKFRIVKLSTIEVNEPIKQHTITIKPSTTEEKQVTNNKLITVNVVELVECNC